MGFYMGKLVFMLMIRCFVEMTNSRSYSINLQKFDSLEREMDSTKHAGVNVRSSCWSETAEVVHVTSTNSSERGSRRRRAKRSTGTTPRR